MGDPDFGVARERRDFGIEQGNDLDTGGSLEEQGDNSLDRTAQPTRIESALDWATSVGFSRAEPDTPADTGVSGSSRVAPDTPVDTGVSGSSRVEPDTHADTGVSGSSRVEPETPVDTGVPGSSRVEPDTPVDTGVSGSSRVEPDAPADTSVSGSSFDHAVGTNLAA